MKKILLVLFVFLTTISYAQENIRKVKSSVLYAYPTVTIGKALESIFNNPKWTEHTTKNGSPQVVFKGNIKSSMFKDYYGVDRKVYVDHLKKNPTDLSMAMMIMGMDMDTIFDEILKPDSPITIIFSIHIDKKHSSIIDYTCDSCMKDMLLIDFIFEAK